MSPVYSCVEKDRQNCNINNGVIGPDPNHYCIVCRKPTHIVCGKTPHPSVKGKYAPDAPSDGCVVCSVCNNAGKDGGIDRDSHIDQALKENEVNPNEQYKFRIMEELVPADVKTLSHLEVQESPVQRVFRDHMHYACIAATNLRSESSKCDRARLILPGTPCGTYCSESKLQIDKRRRNAEKVRRYRLRSRSKDKHNARRRYHERKEAQAAESAASEIDTSEHNSDARPFMKLAGNRKTISEIEETDGVYHVYTVTDVYEVRRSFHAYISAKSGEGRVNENGMDVFEVEQDKRGGRQVLHVQQI